jgi:hypothetical protein
MKQLSAVLGVVCVAGIAWVVLQHGRIEDLTATRSRLSAEVSAAPLNTASDDLEPRPSVAKEQSARPPLELLRLRGMVAELERQKAELQGIRAENEKLHAQLAARATNSAGGVKLPPGYIRRSQAQWVGMNTPENTIESFLWSLQNHDVTNLLRALSPRSADQLSRQINRAPEQFFQETAILPGMRIFNQTRVNDHSIAAQVEFMPGDTIKEPIHFELVNGEWKMDMP